MLLISSYENFNSNYYKAYSISFDDGKLALYNGLVYEPLKPKYLYGVNHYQGMSNQEYLYRYIEDYYLSVLRKLNPQDLFNSLDNSVLLDYKDNPTRYIVAFFVELLSKEQINEVKVDDSSIMKIPRNNEIKEMLANIMQKYMLEKENDISCLKLKKTRIL